MVGLMNTGNASITVLLVNFIFIVFSFKLFDSVSAATLKDFVVYELQPGMRVNGSNQRLAIFCYAGVPKHFLHIFQTAKLLEDVPSASHREVWLEGVPLDGTALTLRRGQAGEDKTSKLKNGTDVNM
uniref:Uncharacterized protein n=1 Tax=Timema shepardi TaxID=629360 RepID=A0A7R9AVI1_TIMSH|nr:unnamed protein product [Timema shepardi]